MNNENLKDEIARLVLDELRQSRLQVGKEKLKIPAAISARHIHLQRYHLEILFGKDYELTVLKPISQPGQYAANEKVKLISWKGEIPNVRVLGPERKQTQVEISKTDAHTLGIEPVLRKSGDLNKTPGITLEGPKGRLFIHQGVIVADRHIHMNPKEADLYHLKDGQRVDVKVSGVKSGILGDVIIRVNENSALDLHLDTDDANAFFINNGDLLEII